MDPEDILTIFLAVMSVVLVFKGFSYLRAVGRASKAKKEDKNVKV